MLEHFNLQKINYWLILLAAMYMAGFIGLQWHLTQAFFEMLIPYNLLFSAILLLIFHKEWNRDFFIFLSISYITGYAVEWFGVHTGLVFGSYHYGSSLGYKFSEIPLIIGVNWLLLIYCTGLIAKSVLKYKIAAALLGAFLMVFLDFFIEPVAITYDMWTWDDAHVPLQNYAAWFFISFVLVYLFLGLSFKKENKIAPWIYLFQLLFFIAHNIVYSFFS